MLVALSRLYRSVRMVRLWLWGFEWLGERVHRVNWSEQVLLEYGGPGELCFCGRDGSYIAAASNSGGVNFYLDSSNVPLWYDNTGGNAVSVAVKTLSSPYGVLVGSSNGWVNYYNTAAPGTPYW